MEFHVVILCKVEMFSSDQAACQWKVVTFLATNFHCIITLTWSRYRDKISVYDKHPRYTTLGYTIAINKVIMYFFMWHMEAHQCILITIFYLQ